MFCYLGGLFFLFCRRVTSLGGWLFEHSQEIFKVGTVCPASIAIDSYQKGNNWKRYVPLTNTKKKMVCLDLEIR